MEHKDAAPRLSGEEGGVNKANPVGQGIESRDKAPQPIPGQDDQASAVSLSSKAYNAASFLTKQVWYLLHPEAIPLWPIFQRSRLSA